MGIIVVQKNDFPRQDFPGGGYRCTAPVLYEEHSAQISIVNHVPDRYIEQHSHTVDEVILMLEGQLEVDGHPGEMPKGSVVFVGANNVYGFQCGPEGLTWIFVRPDRPDVDISATDLKPAADTVQRDSRFEAHSTSEIEAVPWSPVEGSPDLQERVVISSGGSPRVSFYRATSSNTLAQKGDRGRFLYVLENTLAVEGQECEAGGVISVPGGTPYTARAKEGEALFWCVEGAVRD